LFFYYLLTASIFSLYRKMFLNKKGNTEKKIIYIVKGDLNEQKF